MPDSLTPEQQLVLSTARSGLKESALQDVHTLLQHPLDWDAVLRQAQWHRTTPLLYRHLKRLDFAGVPEAAEARLSILLHAGVRKSLVLHSELVQLLRIFKQHGIDALPFKGPALAEYAYGEKTLRVFSDLDILVRKEELLDAKALLLEMGYRPHRNLSAEDESDFIDTQLGYEFLKNDGSTVVELHWSFLNTIHAFNMDPESIWQRSVPINIGGVQTNRLSDSDSLIYLCAHGAKHYWEHLIWVADIAELLKARSDNLDWEDIINRTDQLNCRRILLLGLTLARELADAPVPAPFRELASRDRTLSRMKKQVYRWQFEEQRPDLIETGQLRFHLGMRERKWDRLPYYAHVVRLLVQPTEKDYEFLRLPQLLHFMYYFIRPARLIYESINSATRARQASSSDA